MLSTLNYEADDRVYPCGSKYTAKVSNLQSAVENFLIY